MPPVYQSHMNDPGFESFADRTTARIGEMTIAGRQAGLSLAQSIQEMQQRRESHNVEIAAAKIKADAMQAELDQFKTLNTMDMLEVQKNRIMFEERARTEKAKLGLDVANATREYEQWASPKIAKILALRDEEGYVAFKLEAIEKFGDNLWLIEQGSDKSPDKIQKIFDETTNSRMDMMLKREAVRSRLATSSFTEQIAEVNMEIEDKLRALQDKKDLADLIGTSNVESLRSTSDGKGGVKADQLEKSMRTFSGVMLNRLREDASASDNTVKFYEELGRMFTPTKERGFFGKLFMGGKEAELMRRGVAAESSDSQEAKDAYSVAQNLRQIANNMASPDEKVAKAAREYMREYIQELQGVTLSRREDLAAGKEIRSSQRKRRDLELRMSGFNPGRPANLSFEEAVRRRESGFSGYNRGSEPSFTAATLEEAIDKAIAAGYEHGDEVILNGKLMRLTR